MNELSAGAPSRHAKTVFLSHAQDDAELASVVAQRLRRAGWEVWSAGDALVPGERWASSVYRALREADVVVLLLTKRASESTAVQMESAAAIAAAEFSSDKHVVPVLLDAEVRPSGVLASYQWLSLASAPPEIVASEVAESLRRLRPVNKTLERLEALEELQMARRALELEWSLEAEESRRRTRLLMVVAAVALVVSSVGVTVALLNVDVGGSLLVAVVGSVQALLGAVAGRYLGSARRRGDG